LDVLISLATSTAGLKPAVLGYVQDLLSFTVTIEDSKLDSFATYLSRSLVACGYPGNFIPNRYLVMLKEEEMGWDSWLKTLAPDGSEKSGRDINHARLRYDGLRSMIMIWYYISWLDGTSWSALVNKTYVQVDLDAMWDLSNWDSIVNSPDSIPWLNNDENANFIVNHILSSILYSNRYTGLGQNLKLSDVEPRLSRMSDRLKWAAPGWVEQTQTLTQSLCSNYEELLALGLKLQTQEQAAFFSQCGFANFITYLNSGFDRRHIPTERALLDKVCSIGVKAFVRLSKFDKHMMKALYFSLTHQFDEPNDLASAKVILGQQPMDAVDETLIRERVRSLKHKNRYVGGPTLLQKYYI
jgi:hypothetical protein